MKSKIMRFDMLMVGDQFIPKGLEVTIICTKIGTRRAINHKGVKFNVTPSTMVDAILKDGNATLLAFARSIKDA